MKIKKKKFEIDVLNILFIYIVLNMLPLILQNYGQFKFISQGTLLYTVYCNGLQILTAIYLIIKKGSNYRVPIWLNLYGLLYLIANIFSFYNGNIIYSQSMFDLINNMTPILGVIILNGIVYQDKIREYQIAQFMKKMVNLVIICSIYNVSHIGNENISITKQFGSFFPNKNTFASLLVIGIICCIFLIIRYNKKYLYILYLIIMSINLILIDSMSSYVSIVIFLAVFLMTYYKKNWIKKSNIIIISIFIFIILIGSNKLDGIISLFTQGDISELNGRLDVWLYGIRMIGQNFLFGLGIGKNREILLSNGIDLDQWHNAYIENMISGGIIIILLQGFIIVNIFYKLNKINIHEKIYKSLLKASTISILVWGLCESWTLFRPGYFSIIMTVFYITLPMLVFRATIIE